MPDELQPLQEVTCPLKTASNGDREDRPRTGHLATDEARRVGTGNAGIVHVADARVR